MLTIKRLNKIFWWICTQLIMQREFKVIEKKAIIISPLQIDYAESIIIREGVFIAKGGWLFGNKDRDISLMIDKYTVIGHFCHIVAVESIKIENSVLIADKVFITDCMHNYGCVTKPVLAQGIKNLKPIVIGEGSWIGENVCICGANIGKHRSEERRVGKECRL